MKLSQDGPHLTLHDRPGCIWLFGLIFVASGLFVLWGLAGGFNNSDDLSLRARLIITMIAIAHMAGGLYTLRAHPAITAHFDGREQRASIQQRSLLHRHDWQGHFSEIHAVVIEEERDSDGDPIFTVGLRLKRGRVVTLTALPRHTREPCEQLAARLRAFLGLPPPEARG